MAPAHAYTAGFSIHLMHNRDWCLQAALTGAVESECHAQGCRLWGRGAGHAEWRRHAWGCVSTGAGERECRLLRDHTTCPGKGQAPHGSGVARTLVAAAYWPVSRLNAFAIAEQLLTVSWVRRARGSHGVSHGESPTMGWRCPGRRCWAGQCRWLRCCWQQHANRSCRGQDEDAPHP